MTTGDAPELDSRREHARREAWEDRARRLERSPQYLLGSALLRLRPTRRSIRGLISDLRTVREAAHTVRRVNISTPRPLLPSLQVSGPDNMCRLLSELLPLDSPPIASLRVLAPGHSPATHPSDSANLPPIDWDLTATDRGEWGGNPRTAEGPRRGILSIGRRQWPWNHPVGAASGPGSYASARVTEVTIHGTQAWWAARESVAAGTPAVSLDQHGPGILRSSSRRDARNVARSLSRDAEKAERLGIRGRRWQHEARRTCLGFLAPMIEEVTGWRPASPTMVSVVCVTNRPRQLLHTLENFRTQEGVDAELILVCHGEGFDPRQVIAALGPMGAAPLFAPSDLTLGECIELGRSAARGQILAKFDDDDHYGPHYLRDAVDTLERTGAAVVGKHSYFAYAEEADATFLRFPGRSQQWTHRVAGCTLVFDLAQVADIAFPPLSRGEDSGFLERCSRRGLGIYADHPFGFIQTRRVPTDHAWSIPTDDYLLAARRRGSGRCDDVLDP